MTGHPDKGFSSKLWLTPEDAQRHGAITYLGVPCKRGHSGVRYVVGGTCVSCVKDRGLAQHAKVDRRGIDAVAEERRFRDALKEVWE